MLFGNDTLVLFYDSFSTSYSYTKIGYIDDLNCLEKALGKSNITIKFE
ncbi:cyclophilin-like fold protein [Aliarcobacter cryaerophilus]|nr:cyclophilin-like fold protein [Aliarcobacter cryaerophilus]